MITAVDKISDNILIKYKFSNEIIWNEIIIIWNEIVT